MTPLRTQRLANGMEVEFVDLSNRYFGDYHRVCVAVRIIANASMPRQISRLERMGVAGADVAAVRSQLVEDFWRHAGPYLDRADYPARLAATLARAGGPQPGRHQPR